MKDIPEQKWHHLSAAEVVDSLETTLDVGLDTFEAGRRQTQFGPNTITQKKSTSPLILFLLQFHQPLLTKELVTRICLVGFLLLLGSFGIFEWELRRGSSLEAARTCATNIFVFGEMFYLFNCRSLHHTLFRIGLFSNRWALIGVSLMLLLQLFFTYLPVMNTAFGSQPIGLREWGIIISATLVVYIVIEYEKWLRHRRPA